MALCSPHRGVGVNSGGLHTLLMLSMGAMVTPVRCYAPWKGVRCTQAVVRGRADNVGGQCYITATHTHQPPSFVTQWDTSHDRWNWP